MNAIDQKGRLESAASGSTFLASNKNSSDMSPLQPKSPFSREESSRRDDNSQNFAGFGGNFGGLNLDGPGDSASELKSKSQHIVDRKSNSIAESLKDDEPKKTFRVAADPARQDTRLERVSEKDSEKEEPQTGPEETAAEKEVKSKMDEYVQIKLLGQGALGKVMLAEHKETRERVALKIVHMPTIYEINKERHIYRERDILFQFSKARHVIELKETFVVVSAFCKKLIYLLKKSY